MFEIDAGPVSIETVEQHPLLQGRQRILIVDSQACGLDHFRASGSFRVHVHA
jgi:hypothetical protein